MESIQCQKIKSLAFGSLWIFWAQRLQKWINLDCDLECVVFCSGCSFYLHVTHLWPLWGDKVSMLIHIHCIPTQTAKEDWSDHMQIHQADSPRYVWPDIWLADLQVYTKYGHTWHQMSLLRLGVIKQRKPNQPLILLYHFNKVTFCLIGLGLLLNRLIVLSSNTQLVLVHILDMTL